MKSGWLLVLASCAVKPVTAPAPPPEEMAPIPAGKFVRGHEESDRPDETPAQEVSVAAFSLDRTLVTVAAFERFVAATGYVTTAEGEGWGVASKEGMEDWAWQRVPHGSWRHPFVDASPDADEKEFLRPDAPVVMVSWDDANAYCAHFGKRLPTEMEWEYAMRAGATGTRYPWGESPERNGKLALNYWQGTSHHRNSRDDGYVYVSPVKAYPPNAWGIYDPVGNVWQWTADWYSDKTYSDASGPPKGGKARVLRGGSWWCGPCTCEGNGLFYRGKADPRATFNNNGFRCAQDR
jgi:formylglycine-generating enzyme required for sulfatase activity